MSAVNYVWDDLNDCVLEEVDDDGNVIASYTNEPGPFGKVISQERNGVTSYYHYDGQGNTVALTDDNCNITDTYSYNAFGETIASTGSTTNPFKYGGQYGYYTDSETNDIYIRARTYKPSLGRWLTRDPIGFEGSPYDLYEFCKSNVLNRKDPSGLNSDPRLPGEGGRCGCNIRGVGMVVPTCEQICDAAIRDPKISKDGTAGVICFRGVKCACVFGVPLLFAPGDCPKVDEIIKSHERKHFDDVNCGGGCDLSRPRFKPFVNPIETECHHRRQSLKELQELLDDPMTEAFCKIVIRRLGGGLQTWVDANCGNVPVVNE